MKRVVLEIAGLALIAVGVIAGVKDWSAVVMVPTLVLLGMVLAVAGIVGALPGGSWKEGQLEWPDVDLLDRVDQLKGQLEDTVQGIEQLRDETTQQLDDLRTNYREFNAKLDEFILAQEPDPDDGRTDEQRLTDLREQWEDVDREIGSRQFTGEDYNDGISLESLVESRDAQQRSLDREVRRQAARRRYGRPEGSARQEPGNSH
ncbi:hypothetical protein [Streptomyces sp. SD15]